MIQSLPLPKLTDWPQHWPQYDQPRESGEVDATVPDPLDLIFQPDPSNGEVVGNLGQQPKQNPA